MVVHTSIGSTVAYKAQDGLPERGKGPAPPEPHPC